MSANNLLILPGAAASGGVSFVSGSTLTLTPDDGKEILRQAEPHVAYVAPVVRARTQVVYGNKNWVPPYIYGTTPDFLEVRDWQTLDEGAPFTDRDVGNQNKVCLIGQTIRRELIGAEDAVGKEIRIQNVAFRVVGVLSRKGANMMGIDQDDIVLAPWTTIKFRVAGASAATVNQSAATAATTDPSQRVNSLSALYPGATALYPAASSTQLSDTPQPVRFVNVDQLMVKATRRRSPPRFARSWIRERHRIKPGHDISTFAT